MLPYGGKHCKVSVKPPEGKDLIALIDSDEDKRNLNAVGWSATTQEMNSSWNTTDTHGRKSPVRLFGELGDKVEAMVERIGADINRALVTKQQRMETSSESIKISEQKIKQIWETQEDQLEKINEEFSGKFAVLFQQWEFLMQDFDGKQEKLRREVQEQEKTFEQSRTVQKKRVQTITRAHEKFLKNLEAMEKNNDNLLIGAQNELKEDMNKLKRRLITETQRQELETVRQALQNMFS